MRFFILRLKMASPLFLVRRLDAIDYLPAEVRPEHWAEIGYVE